MRMLGSLYFIVDPEKATPRHLLVMLFKLADYIGAANVVLIWQHLTSYKITFSLKKRVNFI